jgi:sterol desaturase/sphingolipid hydroxylase (fatty acid hydroxylase superfamily)
VESYFETVAGEVFAWIYIGAITILGIWEAIAPRRKSEKSIRLRWTNNVLFYLLGVWLTRLVVPLSCVSVAYLGYQNDWFVLQAVQDFPLWAQVIVALLAMDLLRWVVHRLFHVSSWLWRFHRVHHTDTEFDISTALRFHPVEILLQTLANIGVILLLGLPAVAVLVFEASLLAVNFFNHGNIRLAPRVEHILRKVVVTPDMHRIHHSTDRREYNANYAALFSWWDRLFRTYVQNPNQGHENMSLGIVGYEDKKHLNMGWMLVNPLLAPTPVQVILPSRQSRKS